MGPWHTVYMMMFGMIVLVVPWTLFFYEQDSDTSFFGKMVRPGRRDGSEAPIPGGKASSIHHVVDMVDMVI